MKNQQGDSLTHRVRQNATRFLGSNTIDTTSISKGAKATAHFLAMSRAALDRPVAAPPPTTAAIDAFLKEECAALDKFLTEAEARRDAEAAHAAKLEAQKCELQRRREARRAAHRAAQKGPQDPMKQLSDFIPAADLPAAFRACYAPRKLMVTSTDGPPRVADLVDLDALRPKCGPGYGTGGAGELAELLGVLARHALMVRPNRYRKGGRNWPRQVVLHLSAEMLAAKLGKNIDTVREWTKILEKLGYLHVKPHYTRALRNRSGRKGTVVDGTLYAIRLQPGHQAKLSYQDLSQPYRNLDADRKAGRTAYRVIERAGWLEEQATERQAQQTLNENSVPDGESYIRGSTPIMIKDRYLLDQLKAWAVTPGQVQDPLFFDPRISLPEELEDSVRTVQDVIYLLPSVMETQADKRTILVGILGTALAHALDDNHSQRWYCKTIWAAWTAEMEGRGGLQVLAAQLARLDVDRHEWGTLRRPAALLNARLRAA